MNTAALCDAAVATYALSLMERWEGAWENMRRLTTEDARLGVLDMQRPTGLSALLSPLAKTVCWLGGADIEAHPWTAVERDFTEVRSSSVRGGHLQIRVGTTRSWTDTSSYVENEESTR
ncbi:ubiquinone biosynthesis protein [Nesterenkonia sp. AN1]|nr:ubiquinone biosynthesis protein [Nesterenkonia sp. AN1]